MEIKSISTENTGKDCIYDTENSETLNTHIEFDQFIHIIFIFFFIHMYTFITNKIFIVVNYSMLYSEMLIVRENVLYSHTQVSTYFNKL